MQIDGAVSAEFVQNGGEGFKIPLRVEHRGRESPVEQGQCAAVARRLKPGAVLKETRGQVADRVGSRSSIDIEDRPNRRDVSHCRHRRDGFNYNGELSARGRRDNRNR